MSKGGSGPDSVTQSTSNLPEYAEPYYKDLLARAGYESSLPYESYGERRLQPLSQAEQEAIARFTELGVSGPTDDMKNAMYGATDISLGNPYVDNMLDATNWSQEALATQMGYSPMYQAGEVGDAGQYDPTKFDPRMLNDQAWLETYMSPYQQNVTDIAKREAMRDSQQMAQDYALEAAGQGSLGGYREAIMQAERQRNLGQNLTDIQTQGLQDAYSNAQGALEADRAAQFGAHSQYEDALSRAAGLGLNRYQIGEGAKQAEEDFRMASRAQDLTGIMGVASLGQDAYQSLLAGDQNRLGAIGQMSAMDGQRQQQEIERLLYMQAAGQTERDMTQRGLDIGYGDFLRQQAYPWEQLNAYNSILQGLPYQPGAIQEAYGMGPSDAQQLLGAGIAGVGLYNAIR